MTDIIVDPHKRHLAEEVYRGFAKTFNIEESAAARWGTRTYQTLSLLLEGSYRQDEEDFYNHLDSYVDVVEDLLEHPEVLTQIVGKKGVEVLDRGLSIIIDRTNEAIATQVSEAEIGMFCTLSEGGRSIFAEAGYDPDDFMPDPVCRLAIMIRENYNSYEATLLGLRT
jgi:hypothetical protein